MKFKFRGMTIIVKEDYETMSKKAASIVAAQVTLKPDSVFGFATGSTPEGMYSVLGDLCQNDEVDFSEASSFNLDEYYPIEASNPQSYAYFMHSNLFDHVNFKEGTTHLPNGESSDVSKVCSDYDQAIYEAGGIDLQILGIGGNGHIGFNEPDIHFESGTHLVELDEDTIRANARFFNSIDEVPKQAISMGIKTIMHSKKIVMLVSGEGKAGIVDQMIFGDIVPSVPASILQLHNDVTLILDKAAASIILKKINSTPISA